jgi:hypothetical protein
MCAKNGIFSWRHFGNISSLGSLLTMHDKNWSLCRRRDGSRRFRNIVSFVFLGLMHPINLILCRRRDARRHFGNIHFGFPGLMHSRSGILNRRCCGRRRDAGRRLDNIVSFVFPGLMYAKMESCVGVATLGVVLATLFLLGSLGSCTKVGIFCLPSADAR